MFGAPPSYHGTIKATIVAFGHMFSNIFIDRRKDNSVSGEIIQRLQIPLTYSPKEKWLVRTEQDPTLENHTYTSLPRMAFEVTNYQYDSTRNLNKMNQITCQTENGTLSVFSPVPWNLNISLYILTKNQEDALQILEQILPIFSPAYTFSIKTIPEMDIVQNVPFIINGVSVMDEYDGDLETRRFVTHQLDFTAKLSLYGPVDRPGVIYHTDVNLSSLPDMSHPFTRHHADGDPETLEITDEWLVDF